MTRAETTILNKLSELRARKEHVDSEIEKERYQAKIEALQWAICDLGWI